MNPTDAEELSLHCAALADAIKTPPEPDVYKDRRNLVIYHLRTAARLAREIADHAAAKAKEAKPQ